MKRSRILALAGIASVLGVSVICLFVFYPRVVTAQQKAQAAQSDIIDGWDFSGLTPEQKNAALHLVFPEVYTEAWRKSRTPEQAAKDAISREAIHDPVTYARLNPVRKTPQELERENAAAWAISHPVELAEMTMAARTKQQRDEDAAAAWAFFHPKEAALIDAATRTQAQEAAHQAGIRAITQPVLKPRKLVNQGNTEF